MEMFNNPEYAAYANLLLHNQLTVLKHYPDTQTGRMLRAACDSYNDWAVKFSKEQS